MNWCLIKHKWEYKTENVRYSLFYPLSTGVCGSKFDNVIMSTKVRLCKRCHKKQRSKGIDWVDWSLTKEEERDIKLKDILDND